MAPLRLGRKLAETTRSLFQRDIEEVQQENLDDCATDEIAERLREGEDGPAIFSGCAIRWDEPTMIYEWLGYFTEVFVRGAFKKTIVERRPEGSTSSARARW